MDKQASLFLTPDDSGRTWKPPFHWVEDKDDNGRKYYRVERLWTPDEIHQLVMDHVGKDCVFPRGYKVLILLWEPPLINEYDIVTCENAARNKAIDSSIGMILRMGSDAFKDRARFPSGPTYTYGEWVSFTQGSRQLIEVNGKKLARITDERIIDCIDDPSKVNTSNDLEFEWSNQ